MEKNTLKVAALQFQSVVGDRETNYQKAETIIKENLPASVDILVFPEVWTVGWSCDNFIDAAEDIRKSDTIKFLQRIARKYNVNIIGGSFIEQKKDGSLRNTCPVVNRNADLIATYSKMHLYSYCGSAEGKFVKPGENPVLVKLDGINVGLTICYDIRFPEIFRAYRLAGADLLVNMAAWGLQKPIPWQYLTGARAIENQCYMIALTQSGHIKNDDFNIGHSRIFDFCGNVLDEIKDQREGIMFADLNFSKMYEYRKMCTILNDINDKYEVEIL